MSIKTNDLVEFVYVKKGERVPQVKQDNTIYFIEDKQQIWVGPKFIAHVYTNFSEDIKPWKVKNVSILGEGDRIIAADFNAETGVLSLQRGHNNSLLDFVDVTESSGKLTLTRKPDVDPSDIAGDVVVPAEVDNNEVVHIGTLFNETQVRSVQLPDTLESFADYQFADCSLLEYIRLPDKIQEIARSAFYHSGLESIYIPESVVLIGTNAFLSTQLTDIYYAGTQAQWCDVIIQEGNEIIENATIHFNQKPAVVDDVYQATNPSLKYLNYYQYTKDGEEVIIISGSATTISGHVVIPETIRDLRVVEIDEGTFANRDQITSIYLPSSIVSIQANAFENCSSLNDVYYEGSQDDWNRIDIDDGNASLLSATKHYNQANAVKEDIYQYHDDTKEERYRIFKYVDYSIRDNEVTITGLKQGVLPSDLVGDFIIPEVVSGCRIVAINPGVFQGCSRITLMKLPESIKTIGSGAFSGTGIKAFRLPSGVTIVPTAMLSGCSELIAVYMSDKVATIAEGAFDACTRLTDVFYEGSESDWSHVTVAAGNTPVTSATKHYNQLVAKIQDIYDYHDDTKADKSNTYTIQQVNDIADTKVDKPSILSFITYEVVNSRSITITGVKANINRSDLVGEFVVPDTIEGLPVTKIGDNAFNGCSNVSRFYLPDTLQYIGEAAFRSCSSLIDTVIPESVSHISSKAFMDCSALTSLKLPRSVTSLPTTLVHGTTALTALYLPDTIASIEQNLINHAVTVYYEGSQTQWENIDIALPNEWLLATVHYNQQLAKVQDIYDYHDADKQNINEPALKTNVKTVPGAINELYDNKADKTDVQSADIELQRQIDAITSASDVADIVASYAALQQYDTSHLTDKAVIKVLKDETQEDAITYYRYTKADGSWTFVGGSGPYYTKAETRQELNKKVDKTTFAEHLADKDNPHAVTKSQVGLGNVDNTADKDKPISDPAQVALDKKADKIGYFPDLIAGGADNLTSNISITDTEPYLFRTAGGEQEIGSLMTNDYITGATVGFNQLIQPIRSTTVHEVSVTSENGRYTIQGTTPPNDTGGGRTSYISNASIPMIENHIYYCPRTIDESNMTLILTNKDHTDIYLGVAGSSHQIFQMTQTTGNYGLGFNVSGGSRTYNTSGYIQLFDLTYMFGSVVASQLLNMNISDVTSVFAKLFVNRYYPYNEGTLLSVKTSGHKMVGFNAYNNATDSAKVLKGLLYQITGQYNAESIPAEFDLEDSYFTPTYTTTLNEIAASDGSDVCIHLVWDNERDDEYQEYIEHVYPMSNIELRGLLSLDENNNWVYDGDTYESDGRVTRKYNKVALSSISNSHYGVYGNTGHVVRFSVTDSKAYSTADFGHFSLLSGYSQSDIYWSYNPKYDLSYFIGSSGSQVNFYVRNDSWMWFKDLSNYSSAPAFSYTSGGSYFYKKCSVPTYADIATFVADVGTLLRVQTLTIEVLSDETRNNAKTYYTWYQNINNPMFDEYVKSPSYAILISEPSDWSTNWSQYYEQDVEALSTIKSSLTDVYLVYPRATETTESADPFTNPQVVDNWGTEEYITEELALPVKQHTEYSVDLKAKLEVAPDNPTDDGEYTLVHDKATGKNTYKDRTNWDKKHYPEMSVANADNLISTVKIHDTSAYSIRTSGGYADIGNQLDNVAVEGLTVAWNQLAVALDGTYDSRNNFNGVNGTIQVTGNNTLSYTVGEVRARNANRIESNNSSARPLMIQGHTYLVSSVVNVCRPQTVSFALYNLDTRDGSVWIDKNIEADNVWTRTWYIVNVPATGHMSLRLGFHSTESTVVGDTSYIKDLQIFDITQMFGIKIADYIKGLEQADPGSGIHWFRSMFPKSYYPYCEGQFVSVNIQSHKMVGFNAYNPDTQEAKIVGGHLYQITGGYESLTFEGESLTPDADGQFEVEYSGTLVVTGGNATDTCIHLCWDHEKDGSWEPYTEREYLLDPTVELKGVYSLDTDTDIDDRYCLIPSGTAPTFEPNKYYSFNSVTSKYEKLTTQPYNWSSSWPYNSRFYYKRDVLGDTYESDGTYTQRYKKFTIQELHVSKYLGLYFHDGCTYWCSFMPDDFMLAGTYDSHVAILFSKKYRDGTYFDASSGRYARYGSQAIYSDKCIGTVGSKYLYIRDTEYQMYQPVAAGTEYEPDTYAMQMIASTHADIANLLSKLFATNPKFKRNGTQVNNVAIKVLADETASNKVTYYRGNLTASSTIDTFTRNTSIDYASYIEMGDVAPDDWTTDCTKYFFRDTAVLDALKASLVGIDVIYESTEPTTAEVPSYVSTQWVDDFGTEEWVQTGVTPLPVKHDTYYSSNLRAKLEMAPDSPEGDGHYVVTQEDGENRYDPASNYFFTKEETEGKLSEKVDLPSILSVIDYSITNGEVTIDRVKGEYRHLGSLGGEYEIPDMIEGCPVRYIRQGAFSRQWSLKLSKLPSTLRKIGTGSLYDGEVTYYSDLPNDVPEYSYYRVTTGDGTHSAGGYELREGVWESGGYDVGAFANMYAQTSIVIPDGVEYIGDRSFLYNTKVTHVFVPASVTYIGSGVFGYSHNIESFICMSPVIGAYALFGQYPNTKLTTLVVNDSQWNNVQPWGVGNCPQLAELPENTLRGRSSILSGEFQHMQSLKYIKIPKSVVSIAQNAFTECWLLEDIYYEGTEAEWSQITINANGNDYIRSGYIPLSDRYETAPTFVANKYYQKVGNEYQPVTSSTNWSTIWNTCYSKINFHFNQAEVTKDDIFNYHDNTKQNKNDTNLATISKDVVGAINEVKAIADGATTGIAYSNYQTMIQAYNAFDSNVYRVGHNIYVETVEVPDLWVSAISNTKATYTYVDDATIVNALKTNPYHIQVGYYILSQLETSKVDLSPFVRGISPAGGTVLTPDINGNITIPTGHNTLGLVKSSVGLPIDRTTGEISFFNTADRIGLRWPQFAVTNNFIDVAVRCAMTDGKGAAWTAEQQENGRKRMGINIQSMTQADYDALVTAGTVDPDTYYCIVEDTSGLIVPDPQ